MGKANDEKWAEKWSNGELGREMLNIRMGWIAEFEGK